MEISSLQLRYWAIRGLFDYFLFLLLDLLTNSKHNNILLAFNKSDRSFFAVFLLRSPISSWHVITSTPKRTPKRTPTHSYLFNMSIWVNLKYSGYQAQTYRIIDSDRGIWFIFPVPWTAKPDKSFNFKMHIP